MAHIFRYDGTDLDRAVRALSKKRGTPEMIFAGELIGELRIHIGSLSLNPQKLPWGRGAAVYRVPSRDSAIEWLSDPAFTDYRCQTGEDVIVLVQAGL